MTMASSDGVTIQYADAGFLALVDRASAGAASDFIEGCRPTLETIRGDAISRWPVRTGASRDAFALSSSVTATEVRANLVNTAAYGYFVKYSKWTAADIAAYVTDKSKDGTAPKQLAAAVGRAMYRKHGLGAPSESVAGKSAWTLNVQRPAKAALAELLPRLRASMGRLAGVS